MSTSSRPSLDPRKNPWKRGDVFKALGSNNGGFVLASTADYLEVRWMPDGPVERLTQREVENLLRMAHADDLSASGEKTNLETLQTVEALCNMEEALRQRMARVKTASEREELDRLTRRAFATDGCQWDRKHQATLYQLLVYPESVGLGFRIRERIHRAFCKRHE